MDEQRTVFVGIDVSKDRLDVHLRPSGEAFCVPREGKGMDDLVIRLQRLSAALVVLEATGGFGRPRLRRPWPALGCRSVPLTRARSETVPARWPLGQDRHARRGGDRPFRRARASTSTVASSGTRRGSTSPDLVGRRRVISVIEMIGMETNRGRQAIDKPSLPEGSRATSPISRRSSTRSTTTSATPSSIPQLGAS